jgi:hypothetical protein
MLNIDHLHGDSKIVIDWLNYKSNLQVTSLMSWMTKIRDLIHLFINIKFDHIYREENMKTDVLSKRALLMVLERSTTANGRMATRTPTYFKTPSMICIVNWIYCFFPSNCWIHICVLFSRYFGYFFWNRFLDICLKMTL